MKKEKRSYVISLFCLISVGISFSQNRPDFISAGDTLDFYQYTSAKGKTYTAQLPKNRSPTDYTPVGFVKQPSFVRGGGLLNMNEHSLLLHADGDVLPPALMLGYRYGLLYGWNMGFDIGGSKGVFQAIARTRIENLKTRKTESFFWSNELSAGFKYHKANLGDNTRFDDKSLVAMIDNSLGYRLGQKRRSVLYLLSVFYIDYDLHTPHRQTDYYLIPAIVGFEAMTGEHANIFIELGAAYSLNGMQLADQSIAFDNSWFPTIRVGVALRTGSKTAIYYAKETMPLSRGRQPKEVK